MWQKLILIFVLILKFQYSFTQDNTLQHLFFDIEHTKLTLYSNEKNSYTAKSSIKEFDNYMYISNNSKPNAVETISLMKLDQVKGVLFACKGCLSYSSLKITSDNPLYPTFAQSVAGNGVIDRAEFKTNKGIVSVGDNNADKLIDFVSYFMGNGLYSIILLEKKIDSIKANLIFNSIKQEYIGILTFKVTEGKEYFNECFVKAGNVWHSYNISSTAPILISTVSENELFKGMSLPYSQNNSKKAGSMDSLFIKVQEEKFITLFKSTFFVVRNKWLNDYKQINSSNIIGLKFPKLIAISLNRNK